MDDTKIHSWFLGPKAENSELLERLVLEALRDCIFWRRNFHPEDDILITEKVKRTDAFQDSHALIRQEFLSMLANLKRDVPFYSPRYIGHMLGDQLLPAIAAYFAAMLHNPNNVSLEASPITTQYEFEVARQLAALMGYADPTWGHLTSGGTIANFEAFWVARNLKYFPLAARAAALALGLENIHVTLPTGAQTELTAITDNWTLLNLDAAEALGLRGRLIAGYAASHPDLPRQQVEHLVDEQLAAHSLSGKGLHRFFAELDGNHAAGRIFIPATSHYSLQKVVEALGLGRQQLELVPVDRHFRMDTAVLQQRLEECRQQHIPVIAVVSVLGSTEEGAVDQVHRVVALRAALRQQGLTFHHHCDGAWGGYVRTLFFDEQNQPVSTPSDIHEVTHSWPSDELFASYNAVPHTDSVTIDPHKLGYIPYPCGAIVFRHAQVKDLISTDAPYIFHGEEKQERPFIGRHILEGSKPGAAAAACWFAHRVVPLNHSGYGQLIGKSIQSTQELCYRLGRELAPALAQRGIVLRMLTDPPDGNIFCFLVNRAGNHSLAALNRINLAIYDELKFQPESVIQHHNFIISSTELTFPQYGLPGAAGKHSLVEHLTALGVGLDQFGEGARVKVLRCTVMNPWLALARDGKPDFATAFAAELQQVIERVVPAG